MFNLFKKKTKMDFTAVVAHQLKTPLSEIKLSLKMMLEGDFGVMNREQMEMAQKLIEKSNTLIYLVNDLLDMAKIEYIGHSPYNCLEIVVIDLLESIIHFCQAKITAKHIDLVFEKPATPLPMVNIDREKMFLAIKNLLDNAVKYSSENAKIIVSLSLNGKNVLLKVQDFGIGVPASEKQKLFSKFFRAQNAKTVKDGGSGLGLFIAQNIVKAHHGKIWFESKENEGSSFFIELPSE